MITLSLSEAYCYDMYAIALIKANRVQTYATHDEAERIGDQISSEVGHSKHEAIILSDEWDHLYKVNDQMYVRIDEMKQREPTGADARYIDDRVYARFKAKQALQARWFPKEALTETKHGYIGTEHRRV